MLSNIADATISHPIDPATARLQVPKDQQTDRAKAEQVASQFESLFVQQVISKMRESADFSGEGGMFGKGPGSDTYAGWFDSYMSDHMASTGQVGVRDALLRQLEKVGQVAPPEPPTDTPQFDEVVR